MKYLGTDLIKYIQNPHVENYKTMMTDKNVNKWRDIL